MISTKTVFYSVWLSNLQRVHTAEWFLISCVRQCCSKRGAGDLRGASCRCRRCEGSWGKILGREILPIPSRRLEFSFSLWAQLLTTSATLMRARPENYAPHLHGQRKNNNHTMNDDISLSSTRTCLFTAANDRSHKCSTGTYRETSIDPTSCTKHTQRGQSRGHWEHGDKEDTYCTLSSNTPV